MANYESYTTSNFFKVKNIEEFEKDLEIIDGIDLFEINKDKSIVAVSVYGDLYSCNDEGDYTIEDYCNLIQKHMEDEEIVFVSSVGHEKLRYLGADCTIISKDDIEYRDFFSMISQEFDDRCVF